MRPNKKDKKLIFITLILIMLNAFYVTADEPPIPNEGPPILNQDQLQTDFQQYPTPENFNQLPDPTPQDLLKIQNPTIQNFQKLDSNEQADYLSQKYDNKFATDFYQKPDNVGKNQELDNKYFSGDNTPSQSRANIIANTDSSQKYFQSKYSKAYEFNTDIAQDFTFNANENTLTNNGKTLSLESLRAVSDIIKIQVVKDGYIFIKKEKDQESPISIKGDGTGKIEYNNQQLTFAGKDNQKNELTSQGKTDFTFQQDGTITVNGKATGYIYVNNERITLNNHRGTVTFSQNGDFTAENAEINARNYYFDGAGEKKGTDVKLWDHGDTNLDNIRSRNSVFIDEKTSIGVTSQGQSGKPINNQKETVTIHLDKISATSDYKPPSPSENKPAEAQPPPVSPADIEQKRQQALLLHPSTGDLGGSAEVWIKRTDDLQTIVTAKGKVDVGFYNNKVPIIGTPYYRGENGKSELDLKTNGETQLKIRGKATYTDEQYGALEITEQKDIKLHGIRSEQDGSSLSLTRNKAKDDDNIVANCFKCENANVITIDKKITAVSLSKNKRFYSETESAETHISVVQTKDGTLSFTTDTKDLAKIAQLQKEKNIPSISRNLNIVAQTDEKNKQIFHLSKPSGRGQGEITALIETYKDGQKVGNSEQIDFGIHKALGNEVIVIPKEDQSNVDKLLKALKDKKYDDLKDIDFSNNPRLRQLLLQQTKIDIDKIKDKGYIESIKQSVAKFQEFNNQRDKLRQEQGIELNEKGECISSNCNAKWKASLEKDGAIAYRLLAAKTKALQALQDDPELKNEKEKTEINTALRAVQKQRQGIDKTIEVHKQQEKAKVEQQKQQFEAGLAEQDAREQEYYRQEAIAKGIDPKDTGSQSDNRHSQFLGKEKKEAIVQLNNIEKSIQVEKGKIAQASESAITVDAYEHCDGSKSASCFTNARRELGEKYQQIRTQAQSEIKKLEEKKEIQRSYIQEADGQGQLLASLHSVDRPDFAAKIALQSGNPALARQYSAQLVAQVMAKGQAVDQGLYSINDQDSLDRAKAIDSSTYIAEGDFTKAALARNQIQDPTIKKENDAALIDHAIQVLKAEHEETAKLTADKKKEMNDYGFMKYLDVAGRVSGGASAKAGSWVSQGAWFSSANFNWGDSYAETVHQTELDSYQKLAEEKNNQQLIIVHLEQAKADGLSLDEAMKLANKDSIQLQGEKSAKFQLLQDQLTGTQSNEEIVARAELEKAQRTITFHDGKTSIVKNDLKTIAKDYPLTTAGKEAQYELDKLSQCQGMLCANVKGVGGVGVTDEFLQTWGDMGVQVAGIENLIPVGTILKGTTTGVKALAVARLGEGALLTRDIAIGEKLAQASATTGKFFGTEASVYREGIQTAKVDLQAAQETSRVLGETPKTIANVQKAQQSVEQAEASYQGYQTTKRIEKLKYGINPENPEILHQQNLLDANKGLQTARESGDAAKIAEAEQTLQQAQTSLQAHQISQSTSKSIFTREIGLTKRERIANAEVQTAIKDYNAAAKISATSEETAVAGQKLIDSSRRAEEVAESVDFSKKLETAIIAKVGKTEIKIANDIKPLEEAGVVIKVEKVGGQNVVRYDTQALTPAEQKAIQPQIDTVQQKVAATLKQEDLTQIVEGSDHIKLNLNQMYNSPQRAANDVIEDLRIQHTTGETTGTVPVVTQTAATKAALNPVPVQTHTPTPAQVRLLETTPPETSLEQTILENFGGEAALEGDDISALATKTDVGLPSYAKYGDDTITALRNGEEVQVATVDIHRFKDINTEFGHAGGDIVLEEFAASLEQSLKMKGVEIYHKGGKTFKLVCVNCNDDLSRIVSLEMDTIRRTTLERSIPRISKLEGKPILISEEQFNVYAGVSEKVQLASGSTTKEAETIANQLNRQSLEAGKYGQLNLCGKDQHCTQIVQAGEVTPQLKAAGVKEIDISIEALLEHGPPQIVNEYSFFEETIRFNNINELLEARKAALASGDLTKAREIDFQLLNNLARNQNGFIKGNDNFKATINYLLSQTAQGTPIDSRSLIVIGGDETGYIISRNGQVTVGRGDINFFGKVNQQLGVAKADEIKALSLQTIADVLEDARLGKIADNDKTIAREIVSRFNNHMREQNIVIVADIEGQSAKVRPSLTIGVAKSNENIAKLTAAGEKNGASILSKVADAASEEQKIAGKKALLLLSDEIKEIHPEDFIKLGTVKPEDIAAIGKLESKPTDQLVAEFVLSDGKANNLDILKNKPPKTLDELVDESITGSAQKKVEREVVESVQTPSIQKINKEVNIPPPPTKPVINEPSSILPSISTTPTLTKDFPPKAREFLEENGFVKRVSAPPEGQSKAMSQALTDKLKGTTVAELGDQAAMFEDAQGQRWFLKAAVDQNLEDKVGKRLVEDTLRRHQSAEELLRSEFHIQVPQTKALKTSDGFTYIASLVLDNYHTLSKDDYAYMLEEFISNNKISPTKAQQLRQELDFHSTFNIAFRGSDSELAIAQFSDGWHITRVDDELFFAGINIGERRYILPHEYTPTKIAISDRIIAGVYKEDFYLADGTFNQALFDQRFGKHIEKIEQLTQTPEGQARLVKYIEQKGYTQEQAQIIATQLKEVDLRKDLRTLIDADGSAIIEPTDSVSKLIHPKDYQIKSVSQPKTELSQLPAIKIDQNTVKYQGKEYIYSPKTRTWMTIEQSEGNIIQYGTGKITTGIVDKLVNVDNKEIITKLEAARLQIPESLIKSTAIRTGETTVQLKATNYRYNQNTRVWEKEIVSDTKSTTPSITRIGVDDKQVIAKLDAARLELPESLVEESLSTFEELIQPTSTGSFSPQKYEQHVIELVNKVGDPSQLTKEKVKELVLNRAWSEVESGSMTQAEFNNLEKDFEKLYTRSLHSTEEIPKFSEILAHQEPGFTNVHLFRDGSVLGSSDFTYQKLTGIKDPDIRIIYVSRDTTLQQSNKMRDIITQASSESSSLLEFQQKLQIRFNNLMVNDQTFRDSVESTYKYLQSEGLIADGKKLRFVDTCCTGTINLFLEGIVKHYNPNTETRSLLMTSTITLADKSEPLNAGLDGLKVEGLSKASKFSIIKDDTPLMEPMKSGSQIGDENQKISNYYGIHADQTIAFMDQLTVLQQTAQKASGIK